MLIINRTSWQSQIEIHIIWLHGLDNSCVYMCKLVADIDTLGFEWSSYVYKTWQMVFREFLYNEYIFPIEKVAEYRIFFSKLPQKMQEVNIL